MSGEFRNQAILAKIEATYGTDATPIGTDAILVSATSLRPLEGGTVNRGLIKPGLGASPDIHVNSHAALTFSCEIAGEGAAVDVPPDYGPLLRACGLSETINAVVDVDYKGISSGFESITIDFHADGTRHKLLGARGTVRLVFEAGNIPHFEFEFRGLWVTPAAVALPAVDYTGWTDPLPVSNANTPTFSFAGEAGLVLQRLVLDLGVSAVHRDRVNTEEVRITDRQAGGEIRFDAPAVSVKNFFQDAHDNVLNVLSLIHGTVATNIVEIDGQKVQLLSPSYQEDNGIWQVSGTLKFTVDTGDDDFTIKTR